MICTWIIVCLVRLNDRIHLDEKWRAFCEKHIIADDPWDKRRDGPWGRRPEDPDEWNNQ